jgi:hypothetical protein
MRRGELQDIQDALNLVETAADRGKASGTLEGYDIEGINMATYHLRRILKENGWPPKED